MALVLEHLPFMFTMHTRSEKLAPGIAMVYAPIKAAIASRFSVVFQLLTLELA